MGYKLKRILIYPDGVTEKQVYPAVPPISYLCFTAEQANSTVKFSRKGGSAFQYSFEKSSDRNTWTDYITDNNGVGEVITLSNVGDKVYLRNKSETPTNLSTSTSGYYAFTMTGKIAASGDINYLLCKNSTDTLTSDYCYYCLFSGCSSLTAAPELPATTLSLYCYYWMFNSCTQLVLPPELPATTLQTRCYNYMFGNCTNLEGLPELPATTLAAYCYAQMFAGCSKIKLSTTQTGDYTQSYRIPTTGTGTTATQSLNNMFQSTGGTFTGTPTINTTYYTSNTVV